MNKATALKESKVAEAAQAAAVYSEANSNAREAQMYETLAKAFHDVLTAGEEDNAPLLIRRIPFICNDIKWIKSLLWSLLTANGLVLLGIISLAIQRALT